MLNIQNSTNNLPTSITAPDVHLTNHAEARKQQRGIKDSWISLVLEYGHYIYQKGKHSYSVSLDKAGVKQIRNNYGEIAELSKLRNLYLILSDDSVLVTCAYR